MRFASSLFLEENIHFLKETENEKISHYCRQEMNHKMEGAVEGAGAGAGAGAGEERESWLKYVERTYLKSGGPMEINLSSRLRKDILMELHQFYVEKETREKEREKISDDGDLMVRNFSLFWTILFLVLTDL